MSEGKSAVEHWYKPRLTAVNPAGKLITVKQGEPINLDLEVEPYQCLPDEQNWQRRKDPVLSATTTKQVWSSVTHGKPCVIRADGVFKMWYTGSPSGARRKTNGGFGYATSNDGIHWTEFEDNPIVTNEQLPFGRVMQNPFVRYDFEDRIYKMWVSVNTVWDVDEEGTLKEYRNQAGYGESPDGLTWTFHPEPITRSSYMPCVLKLDDGTYLMWVNTKPDDNPDFSSLVTHIFRLRSDDGLRWEEEGLAVTPSGIYKSCPYPFVMRDRGGWAMWYGGHYIDRSKGLFDLTFCRSEDGYTWSCQSEKSVLPASSDKTAFDGRYTSQPVVLSLPGKYVMYYGARDMPEEWVGPDGSRGRDKEGIYRHIGYAELPAEQLEDPTLDFAWTVDEKPSDAAGNAGNGASFAFPEEKPGRHKVTCRAENANGSASYTWDIEVEA